MTDFQRELLKGREKLLFYYDRSDISIKIEDEENDLETLNINLKYNYHFDLSSINIAEFKENLKEKGYISEERFNIVTTEEDFFFEHIINFKIYLSELKKVDSLSNLSDEEIVEYIEEKIYSKTFKNIVFNIGLVEAISYYKILPVQNFIVVGELNEFQKEWWSKLFVKGLGEYRYLNNLLSIKEEDFVNIISNPSTPEVDLKINEEASKYMNVEKQGFLIPVGGGKDSVVTLELLSEYKEKNTMFAVDLKGARKATIDIAGYSHNEIVEVNRIFDPKLKEKNDIGYFNGHIPFSAVIALTSTLTAYILSKKYIALSNESSANEPTVANSDINHQYSKSIDFEKDFRNYLESLNIDIEYFSMLRPLTEVAIAKMFSKYTKYHNVFNSCNVGSKGEKWSWCNNCPKCLFAYIILAPFLYKDKLVEIFGYDVFDNEDLYEDMLKLIGKRDVKPFECVGTKEETIFSLNKLMEKLNVNEETNDLPFLLDKYKEIYLNELHRKKSKLEEKEISMQKKIDQHVNLYNVFVNDNFLPDFLEEKLKKTTIED